MTQSGILYQLDISLLFLWTIAVPDFCLLEIYKDLDSLAYYHIYSQQTHI